MAAVFTHRALATAGNCPSGAESSAEHGGTGDAHHPQDTTAGQAHAPSTHQKPSNPIPFL